MENQKMPQLLVKRNHLVHNVREVVKMCSDQEIAVTGVIKVFNGIPEIASAFVEGGCHSIGSSRIEQLEEMKANHPDVVTMLIRIPMLSELPEVVVSADISLQSEMRVIREINRISREMCRTHEVILMFDLGDLREGYFEREAILSAALEIENELENIHLKGIGTNIGCYGSIRPSVTNMTQLIEIAESIEEQIMRPPEIISGGASTSLSLVADHEMPKRINHLRIGEGITINRDMPDYWGYEFSSLYDDVFTMKAEIVEIKTKASHPIGEIFIDAFGNKPIYEDIGMRKRALLAVGRQDFANHNQLIPNDPQIKIVGSSSDHFILDITDCDRQYDIGDSISFQMYYEALLYLSGSRYVHKCIIDE